MYSLIFINHHVFYDLHRKLKSLETTFGQKWKKWIWVYMEIGPLLKLLVQLSHNEMASMFNKVWFVSFVDGCAFLTLFLDPLFWSGEVLCPPLEMSLKTKSVKNSEQKS